MNESSQPKTAIFVGYPSPLGLAKAFTATQCWRGKYLCPWDISQTINTSYPREWRIS